MYTLIALLVIMTSPIGFLAAPVPIGIYCTTISTMHYEVETFSQTYEVPNGAQLTVENANGSIVVRGWDGPVVDVQAEKKTTRGVDELEKVEIDVNTDEGITIRTMYLDKDAQVAVQYTIKVPGHVVVGQVETSNGSIELTDVRGDVVAMTSNGDVQAHGVDGKIDVTTSNGSIELVDVADFKQVRSANGSISAEILNSPENDMDFVTSNGSIHLYIAGSVTAEVTMSTSLGRVSVHNVAIVPEKKSATFFRGSLGTGGSTIRATTTNGSVNLEALP